ncbi:MAG: peroxiredoxin [Thermoplasmata archaeon]
MIEVGQEAPDFTLPDQNGRPVTLSSFRGRPVILYFYPKADTPGCTRETIDFAQSIPRLETSGAQVIGVSVDPIDRQRGFADRCHAAFPLLSDSDRSVARRYGVLGLFQMARRVTFLLDAEGRVLEIVQGMLPGPHVTAAVRRFGAAPDPRA